VKSRSEQKHTHSRRQTRLAGSAVNHASTIHPLPMPVLRPVFPNFPEIHRIFGRKYLRCICLWGETVRAWKQSLRFVSQIAASKGMNNGIASIAQLVRQSDKTAAQCSAGSGDHSFTGSAEGLPQVWIVVLTRVANRIISKGIQRRVDPEDVASRGGDGVPAGPRTGSCKGSIS
jgi:hypothetical protein